MGHHIAVPLGDNTWAAPFECGETGVAMTRFDAERMPHKSWLRFSPHQDIVSAMTAQLKTVLTMSAHSQPPLRQTDAPSPGLACQ